jgi:hypothetical protein
MGPKKEGRVDIPRNMKKSENHYTLMYSIEQAFCNTEMLQPEEIPSRYDAKIIFMRHIIIVPYHGGGRSKKINAWYLNTHTWFIYNLNRV